MRQSIERKPEISTIERSEEMVIDVQRSTSFLDQNIASTSECGTVRLGRDNLVLECIDRRSADYSVARVYALCT